jgi:tripartite-type tricarboxylate transporter receptor subunit TctC
MKKSKKLMSLFCFLLMFFFIQTMKVSHAEEKYPTRTIKFILSMPAGGSTDSVCRKLGDLVGKSLGQEIIIENKPGAGGALAASFLAKSKPDGYTIGAVVSSTFVTTPFFTKMDFDPLTDLTPIVQVFTANHLLYVATGSPIKTFKDFIEEGRKRQILVGCVGMLIGEMALQRLADLAKLNVKLVPFGGGPQCVVALLGGQVDVVVCTGQVPFVRAGKLRLIARLTEEPIKEYKDIPHVKEFGYDVNAPGFVGIFGPNGLPRHIHMKLEGEFTRAVLNPSAIEYIDNFGEVATFRNSKDFGNFIKEEHDRAGKMIKELGLGIYAKEKK